MGLLITLVLGVFILIGAGVAGASKDEHKITELSVAVALGAIIMLLVLDLLPEAVEGIEHIGWITTVIAVAAGFCILLLLDRFLPDSPAAHGEAHEHSHPHGSTFHVSIAVVIALTVHNVIEGMSVYGVASQSVTAALMLAFGIGIHNLPMGMIIYSGVRGQSMGRRVLVLGLATLSTFMGGLLMLALGTGPDDRVVHFMIALTVGLLLYIVVCELVPHATHSNNKGMTVAGVLVGAVIVFLGVSLAGMA